MLMWKILNEGTLGSYEWLFESYVNENVEMYIISWKGELAEFKYLQQTQYWKLFSIEIGMKGQMFI